MKRGKKICNALRDVRRQIALANDIPYETTDCHHEGECLGTCPKCEQEVRYIENQLSLRRAAGKAVSLVGLSLGISAAFASCGNQPAATNQATSETNQIIKSEGENIEMIKVGKKDPSAIDQNIEGDIEIEEIEVIPSLGDANDEIIVDLSADSGPSEGMIDPEEAIYTVVERQPEFPGGDEALMEFIKKNRHYPKDYEGCAQGRVTLSFTIEKDGSISNIEVMRSPCEEFSREAIRVVEMMPKWKPGVLKGKKVRVKYVLPITFRLQ